MKPCGGRVRWRVGRIFMLVAALSLALAANLGAQGRGNAAQGPPDTKTARTAAPKDLTGYWVSVVTELWRYRMIVPDKNDYQYVPVNPEGRRVADTWDPAKDQATGNACKSYAAPAILSVPGRLHIFWKDDSTLQMDTDSGTQTRLLHFGGSAPQNEPPTWQGYSVASWEGEQHVDRRDGFGGPVQDPTGKLMPGPAMKQADYLKVATTHMRPGYLKKNGIPYGGNATLEEFFDVFSDPYVGNTTWLTVTSVVTDPQYLIEPLFTHVHFKKLPGNAGAAPDSSSGWDPTPCRADQPR
jgi:hypothetical protein